MQEHIKKMAVEADPEFGNPDGDMPDAIVGMDAITRFAQGVAIECLGIIEGNCQYWFFTVDEISARFGLDG